MDGEWIDRDSPALKDEDGGRERERERESEC